MREIGQSLQSEPERKPGQDSALGPPRAERAFGTTERAERAFGTTGQWPP